MSKLAHAQGDEIKYAAMQQNNKEKCAMFKQFQLLYSI